MINEIKRIVDGSDLFYGNVFTALRADENNFIALLDLIICICDIYHQLIHTDAADDRPGLTADEDTAFVG